MFKTTIAAAPIPAPYPVAKYLGSTASEQSKIAAACSAASDGPCSLPIHIALFFDGTNNNLYRDKEGVRVGVPGADKKPTPIESKPVAPELADHSNVARLFLAFPSTKMDQGIFSFYMPGLGTPFPQIGDATETQEGKAFGKGGQPRIIWALLQVINAIHSAVVGKVLYDEKTAGNLANSYDEKVGSTSQDIYGERRTITHQTKPKFSLDLTTLNSKTRSQRAMPAP